MKKFDNELAVLKRRLVEMGELAESMIDLSIKGLMNRDLDVFKEVLVEEERLDHLQVEIDNEAVRLLTVYSPVATDLRFVLMVSRINSELERIGDQAVNMCEYIQLLASGTDAAMLREYPRMARVVRGMVRDALQAFFDSDAAKAKEVMAADDVVDALNDQILRERLAEQPEDLAASVALILIARSLERVADQATNICEEVIYIVRGEDIRHTGHPG